MKKYGSEVAEEERTAKMQQKKQAEDGDLRNKGEVPDYKPKSHSIRGCRRLSWKRNSLDS